jgi:sterol 3beta-glucosyltransferase
MSKILLCSLGSRGDMEPFLAKGEELIKEGNEVAFCFPIQFKPLALEVSPLFYPQDKCFIELIDSPEVRKIIGQVGSGWSRIRTMLKLIKQTKPIQQQMVRDQYSAISHFNPDKIISHIKCIYPVIYGIHESREVEILSPMPCLVHPVEDEPHIGFGSPGPKWWNLLTYRLAERALIHQSILGYGKSFLKENGIHLTAKELKTFFNEKVNVEYAISPELFTRPHYWPEQAKITYFRERDKAKHQKSYKTLESFLKKNPNPVFITFGSMVNAQPKAVGRDIVDVLLKFKQAAIINVSWGGIELAETLPEYVHKVDDVPYDYLIPQVSAVIHHGGSGTTHSVFRCGKPQAIIPHIGDQFFWARQVEKKQVGIAGFPIKKWTNKRFTDVFKRLMERTN